MKLFLRNMSEFDAVRDRSVFTAGSMRVDPTSLPSLYKHTCNNQQTKPIHFKSDCINQDWDCHNYSIRGSVSWTSKKKGWKTVTEESWLKNKREGESSVQGNERNVKWWKAVHEWKHVYIVWNVRQKYWIWQRGKRVNINF